MTGVRTVRESPRAALGGVLPDSRLVVLTRGRGLTPSGDSGAVPETVKVITNVFTLVRQREAEATGGG